MYKVLRERKCEPRMSFPAKLLCKYKDNRSNNLKPQVPVKDTKHQNSPFQKMARKAVMKGLDRYSMARSTYFEGQSTLPEHLNNCPLI